MRISEEYRKQNTELHESNSKFGGRGHKWAPRVADYMRAAGARDVLDYGCGKGTLVAALGVEFASRGYDPARPGYDATPVPADFVTCLDVLEHIEPECLTDVLEHLASLIVKEGLFVISLIPSDKNLPDGRNAHLIVETADWWIEALKPYFTWEKVPVWRRKTDKTELAVLVKPRQ